MGYPTKGAHEYPPSRGPQAAFWGAWIERLTCHSYQAAAVNRKAGNPSFGDSRFPDLD